MNNTPPFPPPSGEPYGEAPRSPGTPPVPDQFADAAAPPPAAPQPGFAPFPGPPPPPPTGPSTSALPSPPVKQRSGRTGFAAGVLAAALVVGGGAGIGGAAAFSALNGDSGSTSASAGDHTTSDQSTQVADSTDTPPAKGSVEQVAATVLPSVVKLNVSSGQESGSGSGIIMSADGLILTNNHVAEIAGGSGGQIVVDFNDGSHATATIVGTDPLTDTALVQADDVSGLTPAVIGHSSNLDVGEQVVAIGSPFGLNATVTSGIVSALDRPVNVGSDAQGNATVYPAVQTDAAINPGNSGGPLVNMKGQVIGINSSIQSTATTGGEAGSIGLGFAIPIDEVLPVIDQMKNGETPSHARLGISVEDVATGNGAQVSDGARVREITNGSAAGQAGLEAGDVITKIDDHLITSSDSLVATVRSYRPGDDVKVTYLRNGQEETTTLTLDSDAAES